MDLSGLIDFLARKHMTRLLLCFEPGQELRFHEVSECVGEIPNKTLSRRLDELQEEGFMERRELDGPRRGTCYRLTEDGADLLGCIDRLDRCRRTW